MKATIAYIMSRFPNLPETFILREMNALEQQGWHLALYPLIAQTQPIIHAQAVPWTRRAHHLPFLSRQVLAANGRTLIEQPYPYTAACARALWENRTNFNLFARAVLLMPKAICAARWMQQESIAHIHAHYATHPALMAWLIHRLTGISYSITVHAHDIFVRTAMLTTKLRDAAFIVAISEYNREHLAHLVGDWVRAKTHLVHCGVEPSDYSPRTQPYNPNERFELISIGSLQIYKGHRYLIEACARLRDRGIAFRCRIVGEGVERPRLAQMIRDLKLESQVELLGAQSQDQVAQLLPTTHCYVQPSVIAPSGKMEGIPVSLMEALACAVPVIATSLSGVPELVRHGQTGRLVSPANADALADAIAHVYSEPQQARQFALAGRDLVLREFDVQSNAQHLGELFTHAIQIHADTPQLSNLFSQVSR
jgi:colanic acid/amylovoran biosynthesis glycosyltransferase